MKQWIFWIILSVAVVVQGELTTIPLVLLILLVAFIKTKQTSLFIGAFISGLFLDIFHLETQIGQTSLVIIFILTLILLYEKKFEINTIQFTCVSSFFATLIFSLLHHMDIRIEFLVVSCLFSGLLFVCMGLFGNTVPKKSKISY